MVEPKLLTLWHYNQSGLMKQTEIAELLELSSKQTSRYMQKWDDEGWFKLKSGKGRGHSTKIEWLKHVESIYEEEVGKSIKYESIEKSAKLLTYHWSSECRDRLMRLFQTRLGFHAEGKDKLIIPRKRPFMSFHPLEALDTNSANIVSNLYNRLIYLTEDNELQPELAHSWEQSDCLVRLYIRKGVKFHDGTTLTADDVVNSLQSQRYHPNHKDIWTPVERIHSPASYVVEINLKHTCSYFLYLLSTIHSSIYKENNIGTGGFYLECNDKTKTVLRAFEGYYKERALLDCIEFVQMPSDFATIYRSSGNEDIIDTFKVESDSGFGVVIMNAYRDTDIRRQEVREFIHYVISKHRSSINQVMPKVLPNPNGILGDHSVPIQVNQVPLPELTSPLILQMTNYTEKLALWLKKVFEEEGIPVETKKITFEECLHNGYTDHGTDFFIHGEVFEMNQSLSFFHFLLMNSSPLAKILKEMGTRNELMDLYASTPFKNWKQLNVQVEQKLIGANLMIPFYYSKRSILFTDDIKNIRIKNFGYVDFSTLWMKPTITK